MKNVQVALYPGIRPGKPTSDYLNQILNYIVFIGASRTCVYRICSDISSMEYSTQTYPFGGTSIIIIVGVVIETIEAD